MVYVTSGFIPTTSTSTIIHVAGQHMDTKGCESSRGSTQSNVNSVQQH